MIKLDKITFKYNDEYIFQEASAEINKKTCILVGESGSGKSTLALMLNAINRAKEGTISVFDYLIDQDFKIKKNRLLRKDISYVWQMADTQIFNATVFDELTYNLKNFNLNPENYRIEILKYFTIFNLPIALLNKSPFKLSGGQKKKIAIISAILQQPKLLILDEPTVSLDPQSREDIFEILKHIDVNLLIITHDNELFNELEEDIEVLEICNKKLIKYETKEKYLKTKFQQKEFNLIPLRYHYGDILGVDFNSVYHTTSDYDFVKKFGDICRVK